jgi:hypothetical protein
MVFDLNSLFQGGISVAALVTVGLGAFKLGSRQWERLYRAKSTELEEIKDNPMAVDSMAAARRIIESTTTNLSATIAKLTAERITIEQDLEEKDNKLKDLASQQEMVLRCYVWVVTASGSRVDVEFAGQQIDHGLEVSD